VKCNTNLFEIVFALGSSGGFAGLLDGRQKQGNEDGDNGNDNEEFDERKAAGARPSERTQ
jgi:hypothetical protein